MTIKTIFSFVLLFNGFINCDSQNLVLNPGAEGAPAGTSWTISSTGNSACAVGTAASTYTNWIMTPDNSANYPAAHGGIKTFFAGCSSTVPGGPFELFQDIDVSADAMLIDAGNIKYIFSGFIQTPIPPQGDAGRFIIDYLNAGGMVLGTSFTSPNQSNASCNCTSWNLVTNTRTAVSGTRKIRIRLQATVATGPAINAYFDDISLTKSTVLPIVLISFTGSELNGDIRLNWMTGDAVDFSRFEIDKSSDADRFLPLADVNYNSNLSDYNFYYKMTAAENRLFFRLKMIDIDNRFVYSTTLEINRSTLQSFGISPNPAKKNIIVTGLAFKGTVIITAVNGKKMLELNVSSDVLSVDLSMFTHGLYILSYRYDNSVKTEEFLVQ